MGYAECSTVITEEILEDGRGDRGGWTRKQLEQLGVSWPPHHGWRRALVGRAVPTRYIKRFLELRRTHPTTPSLFGEREEKPSRALERADALLAAGEFSPGRR